MRDIDFLSEGTYLVLPTKANPKVLLSINNSASAKRALKLYNPFSFKAKFLKVVVQFFCLYCNPLAKVFLPTVKVSKSDFIFFLEKKLKTSTLTSSLYKATIKDKVVLQLQTDNSIIGYVKYPLNNIGIKHLLNEKKAIEILSEKHLVDSFILSDTYNEKPFLVLKELEGEIKKNNKLDIDAILNAYKKPKSFLLKEHPRVKQLREALKIYDLENYLIILDHICETSRELYDEVFEHGDFAPWNIIESENENMPFDFEYFEEQGLEYLDKIKYHFQIEHLLQGKSGLKLIDAVSAKIDAKEFVIIFKVFLIKEIINKKEVKQSTELEESLFKVLNHG